MTPAKKKKKPTAVEIVTKPELAPKQRRFWAVVNRKDAIGVWLLSIGSAFCGGYLLTDKAHLHEKVVLYVGSVFILFGVHFLSSTRTEAAIRSAVEAVRSIRKKED